MDFEQGLQQEIASIIKAFPLISPPKETLPYCTYQLINTNRLHTLDGFNGGVYADYQINVFAASYAEIKQYGKAIVDHFKNFTGNLGTTGKYINRCKFINENPVFDNQLAETHYRDILEIRFYYVE